MEWQDDELEAYLRQFRPRQPRPPREMVGLSQRQRGILASAALIAIAGGIVLSMLRHQPSLPVQPAAVPSPVRAANARDDVARTFTLGRLTALGQSDPEELEAVLTAGSAHLLPHVERTDSTLHALAKD